MAKKKSGTPIYDEHKKFHDLVGRLKDVEDHPDITSLAHRVHGVASTYLQSNADKSHGKVIWEEQGDDKHREFSDSLWDAAAEHIAEKYLNLTPDRIKEFKKQKTRDGESFWENMMARYVGSDKETFFNKIKDENEMTAMNLAQKYIAPFVQHHAGYRRGALLRGEIKKHEDMSGALEYLKIAKGHNKKALSPIKLPKKGSGFTSIDDAIHAMDAAAQHLDKTYHPDKKETYSG